MIRFPSTRKTRIRTPRVRRRVFVGNDRPDTVDDALGTGRRGIHYFAFQKACLK